MSNPYQSPQFASQVPPPASGGADREVLRRVARYQQAVLYALLVNVLFNVVTLGLRSRGGLAALVLLVAAVLIIGVTMVVVFRLANELYNAGIGALCAILMIVPCVALITLLIVNGKATTFLQQHGIKVGLMGANPNVI